VATLRAHAVARSSAVQRGEVEPKDLSGNLVVQLGVSARPELRGLVVFSHTMMPSGEAATAGTLRFTQQ
jgi:hypothetical protein